MSKYEDFCESLSIGESKTTEEQLLREDEERALPQAVGKIIRCMCDYFQCPTEQVRYIDARTGISGGAVQGGPPLIQFDAEKGRHCLDLEIRVGRPDEEHHPVWLHFECVPLRHGGLEFHFGSAIFQVPDETVALYDHVANAINQGLRNKSTPGPTRIGYGQG